MLVSVEGTIDEIVAIAQQLAWMASVFRLSKPAELTTSQIFFKADKAGQFALSILELEIIPEHERFCWHPLFKGFIIAHGFRVPPRHNEIGIELPFNFMVKLANITDASSHHDGLFLRGFSSLLFPTKYVSDPASNTVSIQWHLLISKDDGAPMLGSGLREYNGEWVNISNLETLQKARCFLGWCRDCEIQLGTANSGYSSVTFSGLAKDRGRVLEFKSITLGSSGVGFATAEAELSFPLPRSVVRSTIYDNYNDILNAAKRLMVLLYDTQDRRAWLVPAISVILHMALTWISEHSPSVILPHAKAKWNGAEAAYTAIKTNSKLELGRSPDDDTAIPLSTLVKRLWSTLTHCDIYLATELKRGLSVSYRLLGWEFKDIVDGANILHVKERGFGLSSCGWDALTEDILLLVCARLGEAIKPAKSERICHSWNSVPKDRDYLAASVFCLQALSSRYGRGPSYPRLTDQVIWEQAANMRSVFVKCDHPDMGDGATNCRKVAQRLVKRRLRGEEAVRDNVEHIPQEGAVIFGRRRRF
jgi:hypothetical protein